MASENEDSVPRPRLSCTTCVDALWFCYSPVHQMQQYYRLGVLDNCSEKWTSLFDCLNLKTKRSSEVQMSKKVGAGSGHKEVLQKRNNLIIDIKRIGAIEILETREKAKPHIWSFRTPEEASSHWKELFGHEDEME